MSAVGNVIVLPSGSGGGGSSQDGKYAVLGFQSELPTATITGDDEDSSYPFSFCTDYNDDTQYSPLTESGTVTIEARFSEAKTLGYFGMAIHNAETAGLTVTVSYYSDGVYTTIGTYGSIKNNSPLMAVFNKVTGSRVRIQLTFTSKLYIGYMAIGDSIVFPSTPAVGLNRPQYSRLDKVDKFATSGNNITRSRLTVRGNVARGEFPAYLMDDLDDWFMDYLDHVFASKPVFFRWSNVVDDAIFGRQTPDRMRDISYATWVTTGLPYEIVGYAKR